jgi:oxalate decarboxylase
MSTANLAKAGQPVDHGQPDEAPSLPSPSRHTRRTLLASAIALTATAALAQDKKPKTVKQDRSGSVLGPRDTAIEKQNPDFFDPPKTDHGGVPNLRFSFSAAHRKMREGGWSREVTAREMPAAKEIAGVNMRLEAGGVRELHWHKEAEWSFVLAGKARITAIDNDGHNFVADVGPGDLWYFPSGIPHSIQGLAPDGTEFLLAFSDGSFSEDSTFAITDMFAHMPKDALAKNFGVKQDRFAHIPAAEKFIFKTELPPSLQADTVDNPLGRVPLNMSFKLMQQKPDVSPGGSVRIADTRNFPVSTEIAAALVEVEPGHIREIHWHPNADEWQYYIEGQGRMTVFAAQTNSRTFDYRAGDVGYVPKSMPHFVENTGSTPLRFLELFRSPRYMDVSLKQWMALTPHELVQAHLNLDRGFIDALPKDKRAVV